MRTVIVGDGAMGSLFAGLLARADQEVVVAGHSAEHTRALREGLTVETPRGDSFTVPVRATTDPESAGRADLLVLCVKAFATGSAMEEWAPAYDDATTVLTLQNGLGNAETLADFVEEEQVLAGTTAHGATLLDPGRVRHAGVGATRIGAYFGPNGARTEAVADVLRSAVGVEVVGDTRDAVWEKVLVNVGINAATALARVENGRLAASDPGRRLLERAVSEAARVARREGRTVPEDVVARTRDVARATGSNVSSMRADLERGSRTEIEALNGAVVARAAEYGIATPVNRTLADLVRLADSHSSASKASNSSGDGGASGESDVDSGADSDADPDSSGRGAS